MDNSSKTNHSSNENFLYTEELKSSSNSQQQAQLTVPHRQRSMSLLYCISKQLRRRVRSEQVCCNSQEDLRSSSTDSFSLSLDCGSGSASGCSDKHSRSCSTNLSSDGQSSRTYSNSGSSRMSCSDNNENELDSSSYRPAREHRHSYSHSCYRSVSEMSGSENDNVESNEDNHLAEMSKKTSYKFSARTPLKGLHLNRISMSTVSRVFQHISSSSSSSTSSRSLSCNSTPLKRSKKEQQKDKKAADSNKTETKKAAAAKPQPQQQRILRQPINYVYLKGMSGLPTQRVPRSALCSSFACR